MSEIKSLKDDEVLFFTNNDLSNEDYHAETDHMNGSGLWELFSSCPANWKFAEEKKKQARALVFGTAAHANHLEPELFAREYFRMPEKEDFIKRDDKGEIIPQPNFITSLDGARSFLKEHGVAGYSKMKEAELIETVTNTAAALGINDVVFWHDIVNKANEERGDREGIRGQDYDIIQEMRGVLFNNDSFKEYFVGGMSEVSIFFSYQGLRCKVRLDWISKNGDLVDYKTTDTANPERFMRKCFDLGYPLKMALQREGFKAAFGQKPLRTMLLAQEKNSPFVVAPFAMTTKTLMIGYAQLREAIATFKWCRDNNTWPTYGGGNVIDLDPPYYLENTFRHLWEDSKTKK